MTIHKSDELSLDKINLALRLIQEDVLRLTGKTTTKSTARNIPSGTTGPGGTSGSATVATGPAGPPGADGADGADGTFDTANVAVARDQYQQIVFDRNGAPVTDAAGYCITAATYDYSLVTDRIGNIIIGE